MNVLQWGKPKKARPAKEHTDMYQSDTNVPGTYIPNMSDEDNTAWKAKFIKHGDRRVEIRKNMGAQVLIVVRQEGITISANGKMTMSVEEYINFIAAIREASEVIVMGVIPGE
jgi:hypothetical protein